MSALIFVANARGKVGREIVQQLKDRSAHFRAGVGNLEEAKEVLGDEVALSYVKYSQPDTFTPALEGVKRLFLLHPLMGIGTGEMESFVDAAKDAGVEHIVFMSALGANLQPQDPIYKLEQHIIASGIPYTILRPNWFMQNFNTAELGFINRRNEIMHPSDDHRLSFIDTRDIAACAVEILINGGHEGQEYTLTGDETFSYGDAAALISNLVGRTITHNSPDRFALLEGLQKRGMPENGLQMMRWLYEDMHRDYTAQITTHVHDITGKAPRKLGDYLNEHAYFWQIEK